MTAPDTAGTPRLEAAAGAELTEGLPQNTVLNLVGWAVPVALYLLATPVIVHGLGADGYGIFGIASIASGYLAFLSTSNTTGNTRFLAEAFGRRRWDEFARMTGTGLKLGAAIGGVCMILLLAAAVPLATRAFKIPTQFEADAVWCIRMAAAGFFLNTIMGSLMAVPTSLRRYDQVTGVNLLVGVTNTFGVAGAVSLGWGVRGAVFTQVMATALGVACLGILTFNTLRRIGARVQGPQSGETKRLLSFTALVSFGGIGNTIGSQLDRTIIAALLGPAAVTYYTVPARVTDQMSGLLAKLTTALYPLAAEGVGAGKLPEITRLYLGARRALLWIAVVLAVGVTAVAHELLQLWMGADFARQSSLVLILLAVTTVFRASMYVAWPVANGLGRADVIAGFGWGMCLCYGIPMLALTPRFGITGAAAGCLIGAGPLAFGFDAFVQRRVLGERRWSLMLNAYLRPLLAGAVALTVMMLVPVTGTNRIVDAALRFGLSVAVCGAAAWVLDRSAMIGMLRHARALIRRAPPRLASAKP